MSINEDENTSETLGTVTKPNEKPWTPAEMTRRNTGAAAKAKTKEETKAKKRRREDEDERKSETYRGSSGRLLPRLLPYARGPADRGLQEWQIIKKPGMSMRFLLKCSLSPRVAG